MLTPTKVLDHYYLDARCMLLEVAATLDRYDRSAQSAADDEVVQDGRLDQLYDALSVLADRGAPPQRAERLLKLFSDPDD